MSQYAIYCKDDKVERWTKSIRELIYCAGEVSDECILSELRSLEYTAVIMERLASGCSMDEIKKIVREQGHTGYTISLLGQNMINYSPYGLEFAKQVIGTYATKSKSALCETYKKGLKRRKASTKK